MSLAVPGAGGLGMSSKRQSVIPAKPLGQKKEAEVKEAAEKLAQIGVDKYPDLYKKIDQSVTWTDNRLVRRVEATQQGKLASFQSLPLEQPLLLYSSARCGGERMARICKTLALFIFKEILAYMSNQTVYLVQPAAPRKSVYSISSAKKSTDPELGSRPREIRAHNLCMDVLRMGAEEPLLRDEILCQLMKQTHENKDNDSCLRGWKLLWLCLTSFAPSKELQPAVRAYVASHSPEAVTGSYGVERVQHLALRSLLEIGFEGLFKRGLGKAQDVKAPTLRRIKAVASGNVRPLTFGQLFVESQVVKEERPSLKPGLEEKDSYGYTDIHTGNNKCTHPTAPFQSFAIRSKKGFIPGLVKPNQDRAVWRGNVGNHRDRLLFGVFDGHGQDGHMISSWLIQHLPSRFHDAWKQKGASAQPDELSMELWPSLNEELLKVEDIDCSFSGSTGVVVVLEEKKIHTINVGDSRAILGRRAPGGTKETEDNFIAVEITRDHKPDDAEEVKRIEAAGGRCALKDPDKPAAGVRVWKKDQDVPGLAVTRAFGDSVGRECGITALPEVRSYDIHPDDAFLILASDGIWEFLENQEVVDIACEAEDAESVCKELIDEATLAWQEEDESRDDITLIVIFFPGHKPRPPRLVDDN